jgi:DNA-binding response OmpR family regulator
MPILIVDDQKFIAGMFKMFLAGHLVVLAHDGATALRLFELEKPNIVLTDVELPDMSGFDILDAIRRTRPVPVIVITASDTHASRALAHGAAMALVKPVSKETLVAAVEALQAPALQTP